jgi:hypothetical protein
MKIINNSYGDGDDVALSEITITYRQEVDCCQSENDYDEGCQSLIISTHDGGGGKFLRINTGEAGWSFNNSQDLIDIITDFEKRIKCE